MKCGFSPICLAFGGADSVVRFMLGMGVHVRDESSSLQTKSERGSGEGGDNSLLPRAAFEHAPLAFRAAPFPTCGTS